MNTHGPSVSSSSASGSKVSSVRSSAARSPVSTSHWQGCTLTRPLSPRLTGKDVPSLDPCLHVSLARMRPSLGPCPDSPVDSTLDLLFLSEPPHLSRSPP